MSYHALDGLTIRLFVLQFRLVIQARENGPPLVIGMRGLDTQHRFSLGVAFLGQVFYDDLVEGLGRASSCAASRSWRWTLGRHGVQLSVWVVRWEGWEGWGVRMLNRGGFMRGKLRELGHGEVTRLGGSQGAVG